jgi:hypothetical protein
MNTKTALPAALRTVALLTLCVATACAHHDAASSASAQTTADPASASAATDAPASTATDAAASTATDAAAATATDAPASTATEASAATSSPLAAADATAAPDAAATEAQTASDTNSAAGTQTCTVLPNADVERIVHLTIATVDVSSGPTKCNFTFKEAPTSVTLEYGASGGKDELASLRQVHGVAHSLLGGLVNGAIGSDNSSAAQTAKKIMNDTTPPPLPQLGDDQFAFAMGPAHYLIVLKGDSYVEISGGLFPTDVSGWEAETEFARRTLAAH